MWCFFNSFPLVELFHILGFSPDLDLMCLRLVAAKGGHLLQWEYTYDVFSVFTCEIHNLLLQVAQGAATVTPETIQKVTQVAQFVNALLTSEPTFVDLVAPITNLLTPVVQR